MKSSSSALRASFALGQYAEGEGEEIELDYVFGVALAEALETAGIALEFDNRKKETGAAHTIAISNKESIALVKRGHLAQGDHGGPLRAGGCQ